MKLTPEELNTILEEEGFSSQEKEAFTTIYELEQDLDKIYAKLKKARETTTAVYRTKIIEHPAKLEEMSQEIKKHEKELLERCKALCSKRIHVTELFLSAYPFKTFSHAGKHYAVRYCPICGELFSARRFRNNHAPSDRSLAPHALYNTIHATEELKKDCDSNTFLDENYRFYRESNIITELQKLLRKYEDKLDETTDDSTELSEIIELIKSVLEQFSIVEEKKKEYKRLEGFPLRFCSLFGHDITHKLYSQESEAKCKCCGLTLRWHSLKYCYDKAKLNSMIDLCYVEHSLEGNLITPKEIINVPQREYDRFWDD